MKRTFQTASLSALAAALGFYLWQNGFAANGGSIALPGKFVPNGEGVQPAPAVFHVCGAAGIEAAGADARQGVNAAAVFFGFGSDVHLSICSSNAAAV